MLKTLKKYLYIIYISYKNYTVYSYDILGKFFNFWLRVVVIILLYRLVFNTYGTQNWFGFEQATWAVIFAQIVISSNVRVNTEIDSDIKTWKISVQLLNPLSFVVFKFLEFYPKFLFNATFLFVEWLFIWYFFLWFSKFSVGWLIAWLFMMIWSLLLMFLGYIIIWLLGFYTEDSEAFRWIYSKMTMIFGWNILPIKFLPWVLQTFAYASPFAYTWYTAWNMIVDFNYIVFLKSFGMMSLWIIIYMIIINLIYTSAIKKLNINGW